MEDEGRVELGEVEAAALMRSKAVHVLLDLDNSLKGGIHDRLSPVELCRADGGLHTMVSWGGGATTALALAAIAGKLAALATWLDWPLSWASWASARVLPAFAAASRDVRRCSAESWPLAVFLAVRVAPLIICLTPLRVCWINGSNCSCSSLEVGISNRQHGQLAACISHGCMHCQ